MFQIYTCKTLIKASKVIIINTPIVRIIKGKPILKWTPKRIHKNEIIIFNQWNNDF